jgi:hypothetical protein
MKHATASVCVQKGSLGPGHACVWKETPYLPVVWALLNCAMIVGDGEVDVVEGAVAVPAVDQEAVVHVLGLVGALLVDEHLPLRREDTEGAFD